MRFAALVLLLSLTASAAVKAIRLRKLIDGDGTERTNVVVVVDGDRIRAVTTDVPAGAELIDLSRYTGLPGVIGANCFAAEQPSLFGSGSWTDDTTNGVFVVGQVNYAAPTENHVAMQIPTPEPGTLLLLGSALVALSLRLKLRRA